MYHLRTFAAVIVVSCLTAAVLPSRLCGVMLVKKLGKMCKITDEKTCSRTNYDDINVSLQEVAQQCCSQQCSYSYMQSVCCVLNFGSSYHRKVWYNTKDLYETFQ